MSEAATNSTETIAAGGFRIEIGPDELNVTADRKARTYSTFQKLSVFLAALYIVFYLLPSLFKDGPYALALILLVLAPATLLGWRKGRNNLHCTSEILEVINCSYGRVRRTTTCRKAEVKEIRFGVVSGTFTSHPSCGLIFTVAGKKIKILEDLEIIEAQRLLSELKRLGYDTVYDIGMPMAVEMALERRKSGWI